MIVTGEKSINSVIPAGPPLPQGSPAPEQKMDRDAGPAVDPGGMSVIHAGLKCHLNEIR
jgi:hypothetical protein